MRPEIYIDDMVFAQNRYDSGPQLSGSSQAQDIFHCYN